MIACKNCGTTVTEFESVLTKEVDGQTREELQEVGRFCSITCGEEFTGGGKL